ncbi:MAG TPA: hypothetical protein PKU78_02100, partial [Candidatus Dojkabacteria bacterium]|nr:hypothetical protein [Candidatus Dojkabacteria bacterium]
EPRPQLISEDLLRAYQITRALKFDASLYKAKGARDYLEEVVQHEPLTAKYQMAYQSYVIDMIETKYGRKAQFWSTLQAIRQELTAQFSDILTTANIFVTPDAMKELIDDKIKLLPIEILRAREVGDETEEQFQNNITKWARSMYSKERTDEQIRRAEGYQPPPSATSTTSTTSTSSTMPTTRVIGSPSRIPPPVTITTQHNLNLFNQVKQDAIDPNHFDLRAEMNIVLPGRNPQYKIKPTKSNSIMELPVYKRGNSFQDWWNSFKFAAGMSGYFDNENELLACLVLKMDKEIAEFLKNVASTKMLTLAEAISIIIRTFDYQPRSNIDLMRELVELKQKPDELVSGFMIRITALAAKVNHLTEGQIVEIFLQGLGKHIFADVHKAVDSTMNREQVQAIAIKIEDVYLREKSKFTHVTKPHYTESPKFTKKIKTTQSIQTRNWNPCHICGQRHNSRECEQKFAFYSPEEIKLFLEANIYPRKRVSPPRNRVTRETKFMKQALEQKGHKTEVSNTQSFPRTPVPNRTNTNNPNISNNSTNTTTTRNTNTYTRTPQTTIQKK